MKIQDIRGLEMAGDYVKVIHETGVLLYSNGEETELEIGYDSVVYVPKDLLDEYMSIIQKVCFESHGYREIK